VISNIQPIIAHITVSFDKIGLQLLAMLAAVIILGGIAFLLSLFER
jgi:hypothetical protein